MRLELETEEEFLVELLVVRVVSLEKDADLRNFLVVCSYFLITLIVSIGNYSEPASVI